LLDARDRNDPFKLFEDDGDDEGDEDDEDDEVPEPMLDSGTGPFATSHGKWDDPTTQPNFQQPMDWHISSTYTAEEQAAAEAREQAELDAIVETDAVAENVYEDDVYDFVNYDSGEIDPDRPTPEPKTTMPTSWQEFQFLQAQVSRFAQPSSEVAERLTEEQLQTAKALEEQLQSFYPTFKNILAEGWKLSYNPAVEEAGLFVTELRGTAERKA
jgi:hypothetical protein